MPFRQPLPEMPRYTFGAGDLGHPSGDPKRDAEVARMAIDAGLYFHCSPQYGGRGNEGGTFRFLRRVFDEAGCRPPMIVKVHASTADELRESVESTVRDLGLERLDVAQVVGEYTDYADDFRRRGPRYEAFCELRDSGRVGSFLAEIYPKCHHKVVDVVRDDVADGAIFTLNVLQRNTNAEIDRLLTERAWPIVALRTLSRLWIDFERFDPATADLPERAGVDHVKKLRPLFERSGCRDWLEFNMHFILSHPHVRTTIGATTDPAHLRVYIDAAERFEPMDPAVVAEIQALQPKY